MHVCKKSIYEPIFKIACSFHNNGNKKHNNNVKASYDLCILSTQNVTGPLKGLHSSGDEFHQLTLLQRYQRNSYLMVALGAVPGTP